MTTICVRRTSHSRLKNCVFSSHHYKRDEFLIYRIHEITSQVKSHLEIRRFAKNKEKKFRFIFYSFGIKIT